ncbi:cytidylyltransferase domain-containing protein [Paenisporosarcina cavernae]|uniref:Acylneuraminate cytidylyltransferase family protein n=1 Tax=Paenisporosarcina cavernae TaxID=2320858 RepID=A0A385YTF1_9BACL|nr:acylneuraminate cytidylyltransferase family protein [Paenisporosarcina cavernae]AYC28958.1 acylneuraminate cytidylyltransferase family protein [Paenisporosarcina cavernae]
MKSKILAIIPARGGSKGVIRKNIRNMAGKPLIAWTIEEAKKSKYIDRIILSSEDEEIINVAKKYGCEVPFVRPKELAQDNSTGMDPVLHAINQCPGYDYVVLLQPTSPLRLAEDIDGCIEKVLKEKLHYCVSVSEPPHSPFWMYHVNNVGEMKPVISQPGISTRRQDLKPVYSLNGAIYVGETSKIIESKTFLTDNTRAFVMSSDRSFDIDTELDFKICEFLLGNSER